MCARLDCLSLKIPLSLHAGRVYCGSWKSSALRLKSFCACCKTLLQLYYLIYTCTLDSTDVYHSVLIQDNSLLGRNSCYKCGADGHFARECPSQAEHGGNQRRRGLRSLGWDTWQLFCNTFFIIFPRMFDAIKRSEEWNQFCFDLLCCWLFFTVIPSLLFCQH